MSHHWQNTNQRLICWAVIIGLGLSSVLLLVIITWFEWWILLPLIVVKLVGLLPLQIDRLRKLD